MNYGSTNPRKKINQCVIFITLLLLLSGTASASVTTYYWTPSTGAIGSSRFNANWGSCGAQPTSYKVTKLSNTGFTCNSDQLTTTSTGDQFLAIFPTAYSADIQITGRSGATFYLRERSDHGPVTYRFDLGYAKGGVFTSLGYLTQTVQSGRSASYIINMSSITGTAPSGSYPALKVSVTSSSGEQRIYLGRDGGQSNSNSGRFSVDEVLISPTPTPTPTPTPVPTPVPTPTPAQTGDQIKLGTNRYVILDDDFTGTPEPGFYSPAFGTGSGDPGGGNNAAKGKATTIGAYALYLDKNGIPVPGKNITFTFYKPASKGIFQTKYAITDSNGIASSFSDLDNTFFYGRWKVKAESSSLSAASNFIYNWWGCNYGGSGCDKDHKGKDWPTGAPINSPYMDGYDAVVGKEGEHQVTDVCTGCHRSYDGTNGTANNAYPSAASTIQTGIHQGIKCSNSSCHGSIANHRTNIDIGSCYGEPSCHPFRTEISGKSTLNGAVSAYSNSTGTYDKYHTPGSTVPCIVCHGPVHNTTKPDESQKFIRNNVTEDSHCTNCHQSLNKHKGSVNCTLCHTDDVHVIQVFSQSAGYVNHGSPNQGDCTTCHQNSTFMTALKAQPRAGSYSGPPAPQIKKPLNHSNDPLAGTKWGSHWTSQQTACIYCHSNTLHNLTPLGRILQFAPGYQMYGLIGTNTSCANCHYKGNSNYAQMSSGFTTAGLLIPPEITNSTNWKGISTGYYNHSFATYQDRDCRSCHGSLLSAGVNLGEFQHNAGEGTAGGPNCIACHDVGGSIGDGRLVNFSAMDETNAVHQNLNRGAASSYASSNFKCWACHGDGNEPGTSHPSNYKTPYQCVDCHVLGTGQNLRYTPNSTLLNVIQHYWNGTNITTSGVKSCYSCHNRSEMMVGSDLDPDGPGSVYGGFNGGNNNSAHYGKKRTDMAGLDTISYCTYCHNTSINNATFYVRDFNNSILNHTSRSTTPLCDDCHNTGRMHNSTLAKPTSNDTFCSICHGLGGSAATNNKAEHKALFCTECHANFSTGILTGKDIHAIKYLTQSNTYSTSNSSAVDCTTCHQSSAVDHSIGRFIPPRVNSPLHHSTNINNGSVWGNYWTSPIGACIFCHNDTKHNSTPLGRPLIWNSSYVMNTTIGSGTNCADCHYRGDSNYNAMNSTFASAGLPKPPEITNGSWKGRPGYYNHSFAAYTDSQCKGCHDASSSKTVGELIHNVSIGKAGSADCNSCHDIGGSAPAHINFSVINGTDSVHSGLNRNTASTVDPVNKRCWACHGNGSQPGEHPPNYRTPYKCEDCHVPSGTQNLNFSPAVIPNVTNHYWSGINISTTASSCYQCHNRSEMMLSAFDPDNGSVYGGINGGDKSPNHYGKKSDLAANSGKNSYCDYCHNTSTNNITFSVGDYNNSITNHSDLPTTPLCASCHNTGRIHDSQLEKPVSSDDLCKSCHGRGGNASLRNKSEHKALYCTECHANASNGSIAGRDIHGIKFIQKDNTFSQNRTNAVDCTTCHQSSAVDHSLGKFIPPRVNSPLHHSTNVNNGSVWGNYWTSPIGACIFCHNDTKHNSTPLGRPLIWNSSYVMNTTIGSGTNCADCHYRGDINYNAMNSTFASAGLPKPPEITNGSWEGRPGYYNHSFNKYTDSQCKGCHDISGSENVGQLIHGVAVGQSGGRDCILCHIEGGSAPVYVNATAMSQAVHNGLNRNAVAGLDENNKRCWACHTNASLSSNNIVNENELPVSGHPESYNAPRPCAGCHRNLTGNMNARQVYAHQPDAVPADGNKPVNTRFSCAMCHNNSRLNESQSTLEAEVSHYATTTGLVKGTPSVDQTYCMECHQNMETGKKYGVEGITRSHGSVNCLNCHRVLSNIITYLHDRNVTKPAFYYFGEDNNFCTGCHSVGSSNGWGAQHGNKDSFVSCDNCHMNHTTGIVTRLTYTPGTRQAGTVYHTDTSPYSFNGLAPGNSSFTYGSVEYNRSRCTVCHDRGVVHNLDSDCTNCHKGVDTVIKGTSAYTRAVYHSQNITGGGGPDCIRCHDKTSTDAIHLIDTQAVALGIHANLNAEALNDSNVPAENKKCWGCHQSDGTQPTGMGDRYRNPYTCLECHGNDSKPPQALEALSAIEHFVNGTDIKAVKFAPDNLSSCIFCHNKSEMKVDYEEVDGIWSNISLISHYGKKRADLFLPPNSTNCSYCHQEPAQVNFTDAFVKMNNTNITHNGGAPCSDCHGFGKLHNSTLSGGNCLVCHGTGGQSHKNNITAVDLGAHVDLSSMKGLGGEGMIDVEDCRTCHFGSPHKSAQNPGGVSRANTYYCESCHKGSNNKWGIRSSIQITTNFQHGMTDCSWCHAANDSTERNSRMKNYHVGDPIGAVYNPGPWTPADSRNATCFDCHKDHNGFDEPFHAPGMYPGSGGHLRPMTGCKYCHWAGVTPPPYFGVHYVMAESNDRITKIDSLLVPANVTQGTPISISFDACYAQTGSCYDFIQVELAQYMLKNTTTGSVTIDWTYMNATDGKFNSYSESASAIIDTASLPKGNYTLLVRAMSGAPRNDSARPYYPLNGLMSATYAQYVDVS